MRSTVRLTPTSPLLAGLLYLGINALTSAIAALLLFFLPGLSPFMLFLPTVIAIAWYAGFGAGLLTTIMSVFVITFFLFIRFPKPLVNLNTNYFVELGLFCMVGMFASYIIDLAKKQDIISEYQRKLRQNNNLIETLESNYESAQKEIKARDQFLAIASHELKTPVTSMLLQVQSAIHNIRNVSLANFSVANLLKMLEGTERQSQRLSKMVNDLLNLSLITTGKMDLEPEDTDLSQVVNDVADNFSERMKKDNNHITVDAPKAVTGVWDKVRIAQAVTNLISNAIKYGNNKPIHIQVTSGHHTAKVSVKDQGIGIPADQQKRIFERFERAVSSKEFQGLGVGLYITNQIIKAHKGAIHVQSQINNGTTITLELPLQTPVK